MQFTPRRLTPLQVFKLVAWAMKDHAARQHSHAPENSAQIVNRMATQARRSMKKHARIEAEAARAADWIGKAEARAQRIYQSHDAQEEQRKALAGIEAEAKRPDASGRTAAPEIKPRS